MKRLGKIVVCVAGGLLLSAGARAENVTSPDNPYGRIVERNVFGLNPVPIAPEQPPGDPPPKITLSGIMSILGQWQALFKVATVKPGQPAKDVFYTLSEGQSQDDIEVTHINEKGSLVTFNNHGIVQEIPLANATATGGASSSPGPIGGGGRSGSRFGASAGGMQNPGVAAGGNNNNNGTGNGSSPATSGYSRPSSQSIQPPSMSADATAVWIEAQRLAAHDAHNPIEPILPPTKYTHLNVPVGEPSAP